MIPVMKPWPDEEDARAAAAVVCSAEGISARAGIMAANRQPACADHPRVELPVTERLTGNTLILPLFHTMAEDDLAAVVGTIRRGSGLDDRLVTASRPRAASTA